MAAQKDCKACGKLRDGSSDFVINGVTKNVCTSLKNDTGFSTSNGNNDCTDLDLANDCLIGNMEDELEGYEVCDWKDYMRKFIRNLWNVLKAIICSICGIWTKIHKHDCEIDYLFKGDTFKVGEDPSEGSYVVAGKGVTYLEASGGDPTATDVYLLYIGGALLRGGGSLNFYQNDFTEPNNTKCYNFDDDGDGSRHTNSRKGNTVWKSTGNTVNGNELLYEIRLKKSEFPQIKKLYGGVGQETNMGDYHVNITVFEEGDWAYGQHGRCKASDGSPYSSGFSSGHKVPSGWIYWQVRVSSIQYILSGNENGLQRTPRYWGGIRFNRDNIEC